MARATTYSPSYHLLFFSQPPSTTESYTLSLHDALPISFESTKPEDWGSAVDQLLMSTVFFARETLPHMRKNKWGRLITITSSAVKQPVDGLLLSNSVRAAVTGLARTLANEYEIGRASCRERV